MSSDSFAPHRRDPQQALPDRARPAPERAIDAGAVLEAVADALAVYDAEGRVLQSNTAFDRLFGLDAAERPLAAAELVARGTVSWWSDDGRPLAPDDLPAIRAARHGETLRGVTVRLLGPAGERWLTFSAGPIRLGPSAAGAAVSVRDVTELKRAEQALRESEHRLSVMFRRAPVARFWTRLPERCFDDVNDAWTVLTGVPREQAVGKSSAALRLLPRGELDRFYDELQASGSARMETQLAARHRGLRTVWVTGERVELQGQAYALGAMQDVTEWRRAEHALSRSEQRLRSIFDGAGVGIVEVDADDRFTAVNGRFCEMLGYAPEELLGKRPHDITAPEDLDPTIELNARSHAGELSFFEYEKRYLRKDGGRLWVHVTVSVVRDEAGRYLRTVGTAQDVTERRRAEEALAESRASIEAALARLSEADRRKDEFLGMLSHELRNPLAPIRNALFILDHAPPTGPQARRARDIATRQVTHLTRLVDDLLDVTRIARGKIELRREVLDLCGLVRRTADDYRPLMQDRGLALAVDVPAAPVLVDGDPARLTQVLGNLLNNAAKFTPAGGAVTLSLRPEEGRALLHVADTGPGIAPELLPTLFDPFTQGKQTLARSEGGLGLGLSLVRGLVALHGGAVTVHDRPAGGADFVVSLSRSRPAAAPEARAAPPASAGRAHHRVLVVDDNRDAAESLGDLVRMLGHEVALAYDGPSALAQASRIQPDLVLCDIGLPGMDGYQVARELRSRHDRAVRLVALSGYAQPEDVARALESGFDRHVAKPPDPGKIEGLLA